METVPSACYYPNVKKSLFARLVTALVAVLFSGFSWAGMSQRPEDYAACLMYYNTVDHSSTDVPDQSSPDYILRDTLFSWVETDTSGQELEKRYGKTNWIEIAWCLDSESCQIQHTLNPRYYCFSLNPDFYPIIDGYTCWFPITEICRAMDTMNTDFLSGNRTQESFEKFWKSAYIFYRKQDDSERGPKMKLVDVLGRSRMCSSAPTNTPYYPDVQGKLRLITDYCAKQKTMALLGSLDPLKIKNPIHHLENTDNISAEDVAAINDYRKERNVVTDVKKIWAQTPPTQESGSSIASGGSTTVETGLGTTPTAPGKTPPTEMQREIKQTPNNELPAAETTNGGGGCSLSPKIFKQHFQ